jgi:protein O-GlcNAc transferase
MTSDHVKRNPRSAAGITRTVNAGFAHHQAGRLAQAEALYRKALQKNPEHAEALHLLGVLALQCGKIGPAIQLIERALPALSEFADAHLNLGNALREAGRLTEAADRYRRAIELEPEHGAAQNNLARALNDQGLFEAGLESSRRAVALIPDFSGAHINCAAALLGMERFAEAETPLRRAIELMPDRAESHRDLGRVLTQLGRLDEAVASCRRAVALAPDDPQAHHYFGIALDGLGRLDEAVESYRRALVMRPDQADLHCNLGKTLQAQDRLDEAIDSYRQALALKPDFVEAHYNLAIALQVQKRLDEAVESYRAAVQLKPDFAKAHTNLGNALEAQGRLGEAMASYQRALAADPDFADAHSNLGGALAAQGRHDDAVRSCRRALELRPDFAEAHNNLGNALRAQKGNDEAETSYRQALALKPDFAKAHTNLGIVLNAQNRLDEAVESLRRAAALAPDDAQAYFYLAGSLADLGKHDEAAASYQKLLELEPDHARVYCLQGNVLKAQGKLSEGIACFDRAVALDPGDPHVLTVWFREKQNTCDWSDYYKNEVKVRNAIVAQPSLITAFVLLALSSTPAEQLDCSRRIASALSVPEAQLLPPPQPRSGKRIRLGYLSADLRQHPVAQLIVELIERHDRRDFEVIGYSFGPENRTPMRARFTGAFDRFVDIDKTHHRQAAELIHSDAIDILIDLTGYTAFCRPGILAYRPAPIQVNYLGFPGTMGADFIDYIIVDPFLVPMDQQPFYSEKLVYLPDCYQASDTRRKIADPPPTRAACDLPEQGFVFCSFNNAYKITPTVFDIWMRLLKAVPGSVLWLYTTNDLVKENLRHEASVRGVAAERVVFAQPAPMPEYLARLGLADLFLDTLPYNAGATANDALWAGLPLLTCAGGTYVGRMAGAVLTAAGLPELITTSLEAYESLALRLATEPGLLAGLRQKLTRNRSTVPLFDTARFTRNLEMAYRRMWEIWRAGEPAAPISVPPPAVVLPSVDLEHSEPRPRHSVA